MKLTAEQLFNATISLLSGALSDSGVSWQIEDKRIETMIDLAKRTAALIPDIKPKKWYDTSKLFEGFPWKDGGVTRTEMEAWLKENSGYTSNRSMQTIINNAIAEGVTHKDIHLGKYLPGPDNSHA